MLKGRTCLRRGKDLSAWEAEDWERILQSWEAAPPSSLVLALLVPVSGTLWLGRPGETLCWEAAKEMELVTAAEAATALATKESTEMGSKEAHGEQVVQAVALESLASKPETLAVGAVRVQPVVAGLVWGSMDRARLLSRE